MEDKQDKTSHPGNPSIRSIQRQRRKGMIACFSLFIIHYSLFIIPLQAQNKSRPTLGVLSLDAVNLSVTPILLGNMVRLEVERMNRFEVLDRYELRNQLKDQKPEECFGKSCLLEAGRIIKADKMLSGSVENYEKKYIVTMRMLDVAAASIERTQVLEFLPLPAEVQTMVELSVQRFFGLPSDSLTYRRLTRPSELDNMVTENAPRLNTTGPRMGYAFIAGNSAKILQRPRDQGGFNALPALFQFGYQFETMYLNAGNYQALFEFIPTVTGLDQGLFIPTITILNGIRHNVTGWEFAIGPTFRITTEAEGYYDENNLWQLKPDNATGNRKYTRQLDSRGTATINTGVVIGVGKTFRSGRLNLPVNLYYIPGRNQQQFGISFGFNARRK